MFEIGQMGRSAFRSLVPSDWRSDVGNIPGAGIIIFERDGLAYKDVVTRAG